MNFLIHAAARALEIYLKQKEMAKHVEAGDLCPKCNELYIEKDINKKCKCKNGHTWNAKK